MVKRIGSVRHKTRHKLQKKYKERGKISISRYLQEFQLNDKVYIKMEPGVHKGMTHPRFHGKAGIVVRKQGFCYQVKIKDGNKEKVIIAHPVHLKRCTP